VVVGWLRREQELDDVLLLLMVEWAALLVCIKAGALCRRDEDWESKELGSGGSCNDN
jgi:hypothetical protein